MTHFSAKVVKNRDFNSGLQNNNFDVFLEPFARVNMCFTGWLGTKEWESNIISAMSGRIEFVAPSLLFH